jgi:putative toxin-antitoxin system antitoxin component (TIGR02293 family)
MRTADILTKRISWNSIDDRDILQLINKVREGIKFSFFTGLTDKFPFSLTEWSGFLHLSERTMQRYKKEMHTFDSLQSEKILQITLLYMTGVEVFGNEDKFNSWLETENLALGKVKPKDMLDNAFGISLLKDELSRIEHGVLA